MHITTMKTTAVKAYWIYNAQYPENPGKTIR